MSCNFIQTIIGAAIQAIYNNESATSDPYWANVSFLMHADGAEGATVFTDATGHATLGVALANGLPATKAVAAKFGSTGAFFDGAGGYIGSNYQTLYSMAAGTDFTIEAWINMTSLAGSGQIPQSCILFGVGGNSDGGGQWRYAFYVSPNGALAFDNAPEDGARHFTVTSGANLIKLNTWQHVAIVRKGTVMYMFIDGKAVSYTLTGSSPNVDVACAGYLRIGRLFTSGTWDYRFKGYIDEVRFTRGVARYNTDFTPAPFAFANSA